MPVEWHLLFYERRWRFSVWKWVALKLSLIVMFRNVLRRSLFVPYENGTLCYLFYFYYNVITAEWLFSTITNCCFYCERLISFPFTLCASSTRSFLDKSNINRGKPCSAEWLLRTITKCCCQGYSFPIRLRANAIYLKGKICLNIES